MNSLSLLVTGAPRTKKNSPSIVLIRRRSRKPQPKLLPSAAWQSWCDTAQIRVDLVATLRTVDVAPRQWLLWDGKHSTPWQPLAVPLNCRAHFYREALVGDAVGFYQGLADLLEERGVLANDKWLRSWDGTRLLKDGANPRVELWLEPCDW